MKQSFQMLMTKGATIGFIPIEENANTIESKSNIWTQVYPFKEPARGLVGFNFSRDNNRLVGIKIYYANMCLSNRYFAFAEYFRDNEPIEILFDSGVRSFYFSCDANGTRTSQAIEMTLPATGTAVFDFSDEIIECIELIGFDCALEKMS